MAVIDYISALASPVTSVVNSLLQSNENQKDREFAKEMYQRQYVDNLNLWHMNNMYNDPSQQMQRIHMAGLNPALMYQQGNSGVSSSPARGGEYKPHNMPAPQLEKLDVLGQYYSVQNMRLQNEKLESEIGLNRANEDLLFKKGDYQKLTNDMLENNQVYLNNMVKIKHDIMQQEYDYNYTIPQKFVRDEDGNIVMETDDDGNSQPLTEADLSRTLVDSDGAPIPLAQSRAIYGSLMLYNEIDGQLAKNKLTWASYVTELMKPDVLKRQAKLMAAQTHLSYTQSKVALRNVAVLEGRLKVLQDQFRMNPHGQSLTGQVLRVLEDTGIFKTLTEIGSDAWDWIVDNIGGLLNGNF